MRISDWSSDVCSSDLTVCRASEDGGNRIAAADQPGRCGVDRRHLGGRAWAGGLLCVELALLVAAPVGGDWMNESVVRHDWDKAEVLAMLDRKSTRLNSSH